MALTELGIGQHLVKVVNCETDLFEEGKPYSLMKFKNSSGYFYEKFFAPYCVSQEVKMFFYASNLHILDAEDLMPFFFQKAINSYVVVTVSESINGLSISNYKHPDDVYKYYISIPPVSGNVVDFGVKFFLWDSQQQLIDDEVEMEVLVKRKYFKTFEEAERFLIKEYNEIQNLSDYRDGHRFLFKANKELGERGNVQISISGNTIHYYNELKHRNNEDYKYQVEVYTPDMFGDNTDYEIEFKTEEAAYNFLLNFDGNNGDDRTKSYARFKSKNGILTKEYIASSDRGTSAREQFEEKYIDNMYGNLSKTDQDLLDNAFEGDPENHWNTD